MGNVRIIRVGRRTRGLMGTYTTKPQVIHETIDGETIIIDLVSGTYYSLQGSGAEIWNALAEGADRDGILATVAQAYAGESAAIGTAVDDFLSALEAEGLIAVASPNGTAPAPLPKARGETPFAPPRLEKYTDMQDIILLDPVHNVDDRGWPHAAEAETR
jgi:hypothetical protein